MTHNLLLLRLVRQANTAQVPRVLLQPLQSLLHPLDILQPKLRTDDLHIPQRVHIPLDVDDLGIIESANDLEDTVHRSDVGQEGVAETRTGRRSSRETGDIDAGQERGDFRGGFIGVAEPEETWVGQGDTRLFRVTTSVCVRLVVTACSSGLQDREGSADLHGGVREVGGFPEVGLGEGVEETGFADIGKTNDTDLSPQSAPVLPSPARRHMTHFQVVSRSTQEDLFVLLSLLLRRHLLFDQV